MLFTYRFNDRFVSGNKLPPVILQARQEQADAPRPLRNLMFSGERRGVLLEPLDAIKLFANRRLRVLL